MAENRKCILSMFEADPKAELLDLGCFDGTFTMKLAQEIDTREIYGVDLSVKGLKNAKKKGITVLRCDLNRRLPFIDKYFDVICANQVIEHLYNTDGFIKEIRRVLKPEGYVIISTTNLASLHNIFSLLIGKQPFAADVSDEIIVGNPFDPQYGKKTYAYWSHIRLFTHDALRQLFEYHGFKVEKIEGVGFYPLPISIARLLSLLDKRHSAYVTMKFRKACA